VSSRHLDGRLFSERRTPNTATGHSPIDANAHRARRSSNFLKLSFFCPFRQLARQMSSGMGAPSGLRPTLFRSL
jgi:hypothetical protein